LHMSDSALEAELMMHLHKLSVEIGTRMMGSPANHTAAEYIQHVFEGAGLQVEEQRWQCPYWSSKKSILELDSQQLAAYANTFSPSCDLSAPTVAVGTLAELAAADLMGKIGILYGDLASRALTPKGYTIYNPDRDQQINALLEAKQPAALITLEPYSLVYEPLIQDWDLLIPSISVTHEVGLKLLQHIGQPVHIELVTSSVPSFSANIIARKPGRGQGKLVLCAHYDTKLGTAGTIDNGAGICALLALANRLSNLPSDITFEWVAFSGEEYYASGDVEYARQNDGNFGQILAAINMDGIAQYIGSNSITMMSHSQAFAEEVAEVIAHYPGVVWTEPWPASNHYTFYSRGVPSIALTSTGAMTLLHRPTDTIEWVSVPKMTEVVSLVMDIVERIHTRPLGWAR
jgi:aminopeptidase YwaD